MTPLADAWQRARPKLSAASNLVLRDVAPKIMRVGQLDAELLDQELIQLLQEPLFKALSLIRV
jgi:peroxin-2